MNLLRPIFPAILFVVYPVTALVFAGASAGDGALLYRKHCGGCHPDPLALRSTEKMVMLMREPPAAMPVFGKDRLSDSAAGAIDDFVRRSRMSGKTESAAPVAAQNPVTTGQTGTEPAAAAAPSSPVPARTTPAAAAAMPAPGSGEKKADAVTPRREKKSLRSRSFARSWTVKRLRDGEEAILQKFEIAANGRKEMTVVPIVTLVDYAAKVTAFEVRDNRLKLELTWSWKNYREYWKIETYQLALSDDGKKLSGTYTMQAAGGQNASWQVWAE